MSKERRTVSLEPEVDDYLSRPAVNASALVNELVSRHMNGETGETAVMKLREEQVESEVEHLKTRVEKKREELEAIKEQRKSHEQSKNNQLQDAFDVLETIDEKGMLDASNPAVQKQAEKLGMTPEGLINEYNDEH